MEVSEDEIAMLHGKESRYAGGVVREWYEIEYEIDFENWLDSNESGEIDKSELENQAQNIMNNIDPKSFGSMPGMADMMKGIQEMFNQQDYEETMNQFHSDLETMSEEVEEDDLKNMLNDLHDKSIKFLLDRYDIIYLPKF